MNKTSLESRLLLVVVAFVLTACSAYAHVDMGEDYEVPDIPPIKVMDNGKEVVITLADAFEYHGSPCPGVCAAFRVMTYAFDLLWGDTIPERDDIIVFSRGPMRGVVDVFTLARYGKLEFEVDGVSKATSAAHIPKDMTPGRDKFWFTIIRKSTGKTVDVKISEKLIPEDFFDLRKKIEAEQATEEEDERFDSCRRDLVHKIPAMAQDELFEKTVQYQVIMWGVLPYF